MSEANVILPPPSASNPIPSLSAALRVDNREQLESLLLENPKEPGRPFRQLLVFEDDTLRTLLLRQVLSDPHAQAQQGSAAAKKGNYQAPTKFTLANRQLQSNIVSTQLLIKNNKEDTQPPKQQVDVYTFLLRPWDLSTTQRLLQRVKTKRPQHYRIVYVPTQTALVTHLWQEAGCLTRSNSFNLSLHTLPLRLFPLESDVLSMEIPTRTLTSDAQVIATSARALQHLQDVTATIPRLVSLGPLAEQVLQSHVDLVAASSFLENDNDEPDNGSSSHLTPQPLPADHAAAAAMVLLDRQLDMVTPMVTPLTYEGLLDELFGIDCGFLRVHLDTIQPPEDGEKKEDGKSATSKNDMVLLGVHAGDPHFEKVRDQHVEQFGSFLQHQAMALKERHANFTDGKQKKDLAEIHQFVKQIPIFAQNLQSLTNHIHLAEQIKATTAQVTFREAWQTERSMMEGEICYEALEEYVATHSDSWQLLKWLCVQSICAGGIKSKLFDSLCSQLVQVFGYQLLPVLHRMESLGWIKRHDGLFLERNTPWASLRKALVLIHPEVDTVEPDDVAYVSSGYAPLSVRLVQSTLQGPPKEEVWKSLPGRALDVLQYQPAQDWTATLQLAAGGQRSNSTLPPPLPLGQYAKQLQASSKQKPTLIVVFLGGITYMEIASLRFLSKRPSFPFHIVMVTTKIVNGSTLLQNLAH